MDPTNVNKLPWLQEAEAIARDAARVILEVYATDFAVQGKADASPVTEADDRAERLITPALQRLAAGVPVVAEEAVSRGEVPAVGEAFWLVDPLDGLNLWRLLDAAPPTQRRDGN